MRTRQVLGKRIVKVNQQRFHDDYFGQMVTALRSIELEDGTTIVVEAFPDQDNQHVEAAVYRHGRPVG
jgi:hypothetical protein